MANKFKAGVSDDLRRGVADKGEDIEPQGLEVRRQQLETSLVRKGVLTAPEKNEVGEVVPTTMGQAMKLSSEFLAAVVVGVVLGLGFDQLTGLTPWGLVVFLMLGFAAGVLNVLRVVGTVRPNAIGQSGNDKRVDRGHDREI